MIRPTVADYLAKIPTTVPPGRIVVHNSVKPTRRLGSRGFRAWLDDATAPKRERCECTWAPELGQHYHVIRRPSLT